MYHQVPKVIGSGMITELRKKFPFKNSISKQQAK